MTEREQIGRIPFEAIELDQDFCQLNYSESPCTASLDIGGRECYNTRITCQDPENYTLGTLTLHFCSDAYQIPQDGNYWFPFLKSVRVSPGEINAGGGNRDLSALGKRATISIKMGDRPHTDRIVDPYVDDRKARIPTYDPLDRSTFWAKWRARNPYYLNRIIRYRSGYLKDGQIVDDVTRTFVITGFSGPDSSGNVTIKGKDVLSLAVDRKAQVPNASRGKLSASLGTGDTSATLTPSGIGDVDYPSDGYVRINDEVMAFTRSGDSLTLTRAQYNTVAEEHDADDTVQLCWEFDAEAPDKILERLLKEGAGIPAANLDTTEWANERTTYLSFLYSALITEPTGVAQLASELSEQAQFYAWFDEREDLVKMRAVRPAEDDAIYDLNGSRHLIQESVSIEDKTDQVLTRVIVNYGLRNPTLDLDKANNFAATEVIFSENAETAEQHDGVRSKTVNARWIPKQNAAAALNLGENLIARYQEIPRSILFSLDAKDREVWVGSFARLTTRLNVDDTGEQKPVNAQVIKANESQQGTTFSYQAQEFAFVQPPSPDEQNIPLNSSNNINLRDEYNRITGNTPQDGDTITFIVRNGTFIGSEPSRGIYQGTHWFGLPGIGDGVRVHTTNLPPVIDHDITSEIQHSAGDATPSGLGGDWQLLSDMLRIPAPVALETGSWPSGVTLRLIVEAGGAVYSVGGFGGVHFSSNAPNVSDYTQIHEAWASDGGHALRVTYPIEIENKGTIASGGAGGYGNHGIITSWANGNYNSDNPAVGQYVVAPGGAGAGIDNADTLTIYLQADNENLYRADTQPGTGGDTTGGSYGRASRDFFSTRARVDSEPGSDLATDAEPLPSFAAKYQRGGRKGHAVTEGADLITWTNGRGDLRGPEVN